MRTLGITFYVVAAVITLQTILLVVTNLETPVSKSNANEKPRKVHLLIISTWRSGSSLVGQFFNQNSDVFYLKEPAWHVWKAMPHSHARVLQMAVRDLLESIFKCDMSVLDVYLQNRSHVSNLFNWYTSRALCSPPVCSAYSRKQIVSETDCQKGCDNSPFSKVEESCNTYSHIVLQEFRIFDLKVLYPLLKDPTLNLKILQVVRDPRAFARSREQVKLSLDFDNVVILNSNKRTLNDTDREKVLREICQSQADMYRMVNIHPPPFLKDHYMLLRFEDLVRDTLKIVKQMYAFVGLKLTEELKTWIYKMTHGKGQDDISPFSIMSRNAMTVSLNWRTELTFKEVSSVQQICRDFMDFFHYQNIYSDDDLMDFTFETTLPINKDDFKWYNYNENE